MHFKKMIGLLVLLLSSANLYSAVLFENPYTDGSTAGTSTTFCSACGTSYRVWDTFTLSEASTITSIDARVGTTNQALPSLSFEVFTADRTTSLYSSVFTLAELGATFVGDVQWDISVDIANWGLSAGTYALSIWDMDNAAYQFGWTALTTTYDGSGYQDDGGSGTGRDYAFRVHGTAAVPVPAPLALVGLGLLGLGITQRKKA